METKVEVETLDRICVRVEQGQALSDDEVRQLWATHDILALGTLADTLRRRRHGTTATFVRVAEWPLAVVIGGGRLTIPAGARELRIAGLPSSAGDALSAVRRVAEAAGDLPVTGFSLADLAACCDGDLVRLRELLAALRVAGLSGVAETTVDPDPTRALATAAEAGVPVQRLTVAARPAAGAPAVLDRVAALQRAGAAPSVFAPLPRQQAPEPTTGYEDVKTVALARILLDVPHIQVDWRLHGPKLAQVALTMGADDVDNVSAEEGGPDGRRRSALEEILRNIRAAGLDPVERDGRLAMLR